MDLSVLVVDDVQDWRNMLAGLIQDLFPQAKVLSAASLDEARLHLQPNAIDLAVVDVRLDELDESNVDGLRLMEEIARNHKAVQTIVITGYASIDKVKRSLKPDICGQRPAVDFIEKSKVHLELLPRLRSIIDQQKSE